MDLVTIRELYKKQENYIDKKVTVGGWVRSEERRVGKECSEPC